MNNNFIIKYLWKKYLNFINIKNTVQLKEFKFTFRALSSKNYFLFFIGQAISLLGTWMQFTAMSWLIYRMTNSALILGLVGFTAQFPSLILSPLAGVMADRWSRHNILLITQILSMIHALILAILVITNSITVWEIIALSIFIGIVGAFDMPTRHSFVVDMVEKKELLSNAIALNSSLFNGARLVGPAIAGIIIATAGEGICFLLNSLSFISIIIALLAMKIDSNKGEGNHKNVFQELKEGFYYAFRVVPIRSVLMIIALISLMGMPYATLMPIFAKDIFSGGPHTLGFLMSATGFGALVGAIMLASRESSSGLEKTIPRGVALFGSGLIAFSLSTVFWLSLILLFITAYGMMISITSSNTFIQSIVEEDKRGRVMSLYTTAFMGTMPLGSLLMGSSAHKIGAPYTLMIGGILCILGALLLSKPIRSKIYSHQI